MVIKRTALSVALLGLFAAVSTGCGASAQSVCDDACECSGCSDSQLDACVDGFEDSELDAEQQDCLSEYDDALNCIADNFECKNDVPTSDGCTGKLVTLGECLNGAGQDG
jgi:hypothetical protein